MSFALTLVASSLVLTVAETVPIYNIRPTRQAAMEMTGNQGRTAESCMASETAARGNRQGSAAVSWPTENPLRSTARQGGSPSYVELLICLETNRDARTREQQLKDEQAKAKSLKPAPKLWHREARRQITAAAITATTVAQSKSCSKSGLGITCQRIRLPSCAPCHPN
jgi:hypothetical protein